MKIDEAARRVLSGDTADPAVEIALQQGSDAAGRTYYLLLSAIGRNQFLRQVPGLVAQVIKTDGWRHWVWMSRAFSAPSFKEYITRGPPDGLGATVEMIAKLIDDDPVALAKFRRLTTPKHGEYGRGRSKPKPIDGSNRTIKPLRGTTRAYTLNRLQRDHPELYDQVVVGDLSANAAAIEAGIRKPPIQFPDDPQLVATAILRRWDQWKIQQLIAALKPEIKPCVHPSLQTELAFLREVHEECSR